MSLQQIQCQERAVSSLRRAFAIGRWAQTYLFAGPEGVGRALTAVQWAKLLLCADPPLDASGEPDCCDRCAACRQVDAGTHPDYTLITKELRRYTSEGKGKAAPVDLAIDVIREFLIEKAAVRPAMGRHRVFVVAEAERLNLPAQNALLKVLEEPPTFCSIILVCSRPESLLPTIRSRAQTIRFGPIAAEVIEQDLIRRGVDAERAGWLARLSDGRWGLARRLAELEGHGADLYGGKCRLLQAVVQLELPQCVDTAQKCLDFAKRIAEHWGQIDEATSRKDLQRRAQALVIRFLRTALEDAMKMAVAADTVPVHADQPAVVRQWTQRYPPAVAAERIEDCYEALRWLEAGGNDKLVFERLLFRLVDPGIMAGL